MADAENTDTLSASYCFEPNPEVKKDSYLATGRTGTVVSMKHRVDGAVRAVKMTKEGMTKEGALCAFQSF